MHSQSTTGEDSNSIWIYSEVLVRFCRLYKESKWHQFQNPNEEAKVRNVTQLNQP